ncbi:MAG: hypothetical protein A3G41_08835 [Elusimicrobia bacterium RIFCSPLOWO2_12_FULL_59_9]|nr:MAG: hypothetical protein A3G41_08835 [Elusimicrobia bacterium RIFCSPLOWO2_12_FULL_59_9]
MSPAHEQVFKDGEIIPLHEFESRFRKYFCDGNEITFAQWPVRIEYDADGGLTIFVGAYRDTPLPIDLTEEQP